MRGNAAVALVWRSRAVASFPHDESLWLTNGEVRRVRLSASEFADVRSHDVRLAERVAASGTALAPARGITSGCTGTGAHECSSFAKRACAGPVNLGVRPLRDKSQPDLVEMCTILAIRRLSQGSARVPAFAHSAARRRGRSVLTPDDILYSLILTHDPSTNDLLASIRAADEVRRLADMYGGTLLGSVPPGETKLSTEVTHVLRSARGEAKRLSATRIEPVHLLLGVLRHAQKYPARLLAEHGLTYHEVLAALTRSDDRPRGDRGPSRGRPN